MTCDNVLIEMYYDWARAIKGARSVLDEMEMACSTDSGQPSIVDVLMGRHQHEPLMKITRDQRLYCNYRLHQPSLEAEIATAGRHRNRSVFDLTVDERRGTDPINPEEGR